MFPFRLDLYPADASHLPNHHQKRGYFKLRVRGVRFDDKCLWTTRLPDFALARVRLRQRSGEGGPLWETEIPF